MANWYTGVLKYAIPYFSTLLINMTFILFSTGKRRYGHPALNGVLPEPWLPLKKGQSLVNNDHRPDAPRVGQVNDTVVLTLRKRPSMARNRRASETAGKLTLLLATHLRNSGWVLFS